jgi:hypothetical protein
VLYSRDTKGLFYGHNKAHMVARRFGVEVTRNIEAEATAKLASEIT